MRKVVVSEYITLDGVMQDPGGSGEFALGGWSHAFWDEQASNFKYTELKESDALLLGRVTYEGFAKAWPTMKDTGDFGERMNNYTKYVVSSTLTDALWNNTSIINGNIVAEIISLKKVPGKDILVAGSARLVGLLLENNLVDEFRFLVHPVVLGTGKRLFPEGLPQKTLELTESQAFSKGIVALTYKVL